MSYSDIRGIIFDLGSTLIEYESRPWAEVEYDAQKFAYNRLTAREMLPSFEPFNTRLEEIKAEYRAWSRKTLNEYLAFEPVQDLFRELRLPYPLPLGKEFIDNYYVVVRHQLAVDSEAYSTLQSLKQHGYRIGLISNTRFPGHYQDRDLERFGLLPFFDWRLYSADFGYRKPHPSIYAEGLRRMGIAAKDILYIGDRYLEDVGGPQEAKMKVVLKYQKLREYPDPMPSGFAVIKRLCELLDIVKNGNVNLNRK